MQACFVYMLSLWPHAPDAMRFNTKSMHSCTHVCLCMQLCKARDTAKEQVRDLQEKLKERDKRLIENRNRMESLSRQLRAAGITAAAGPTRTRGCGGDTSPSGHVRNKIETLETENRILRGQLQELNGRPAGSVKLGFGSSSISSAAGGAASRYGLGKAQRVPASEQGTVAGVGVDPGLSLLEMRDVEEQPLGQVEQRQLQGVARDLRAVSVERLRLYAHTMPTLLDIYTYTMRCHATLPCFLRNTCLLTCTPAFLCRACVVWRMHSTAWRVSCTVQSSVQGRLRRGPCCSRWGGGRAAGVPPNNSVSCGATHKYAMIGRASG